jgi:hypothetical protein
VIVVLGWATVIFTLIMLTVVLMLLWRTARLPWVRLHVPREVGNVNWEEDNPFPWI